MGPCGFLFKFGLTCGELHNNFLRKRKNKKQTTKRSGLLNISGYISVVNDFGMYLISFVF